MPTQFANTLNNHPIYADRAEKDAAGNTIATTYQEKLTAGTGINIDSSNVISATGSSPTYTAGNGVDITSDVISVQVTSPNAGDIVTLDCDGHLVDSGVAPSDLQPKLTAGTNITIDANNVISASGGGGGTSYTAGDGISISGTTISAKIDNSTITTNASGQLVANGGGGTSYTAGTGIDISAQDAISVKIDGSTITTNASGQLVANGGGGGSSITTYKFVGPLSTSCTLFTVDGIVFAYNSSNQYVTISSSTVNPVHIFACTGDYNNYYSNGVLINEDTPGSSYSGFYISSPQKLFEIPHSGSYYKGADYTIFYTASNSTNHVIKVSMLAYYVSNSVEYTMYFSVANS